VTDPARLRACASALRHLHQREPQRRCEHLAAWCEEEAARVEKIRRDLEWWPGPTQQDTDA